MKIDTNIINIPPYISTSWKNVVAIHVCGKTADGKKELVFLLSNGSKIVVPGLSDQVIEAIFDAHGKYLENDVEQEKEESKVPPHIDALINKASNLFSPGGGLMNLPLPGSGGMDLVMQHDPSKSNMPDIPKEIISKIVTITKTLGLDKEEELPQPEPHCNCIHCQIARAVNSVSGHEEEEIEVTEADLTFRSWDIEKTGENLYIVTNRLDKQEQYNVYLGKPVGCTCGEKDCEHIKAVLQS